jgi:hypothetical protein
MSSAADDIAQWRKKNEKIKRDWEQKHGQSLTDYFRKHGTAPPDLMPNSDTPVGKHDGALPPKDVHGNKKSGGTNNSGVHNAGQKKDADKWKGSHANGQNTDTTIHEEGGSTGNDTNSEKVSSGTAQVTPAMASFINNANGMLDVLKQGMKAHDAYMEGDYRKSMDSVLKLVDTYHTHSDPNGPSAHLPSDINQVGQANRAMDHSGSAHASEADAEAISNQFVFDQMTRGSNEPLALLAKQEYLQSVARNTAMIP